MPLPASHPSITLPSHTDRHLSPFHAHLIPAWITVSWQGRWLPLSPLYPCWLSSLAPFTPAHDCPSVPHVWEQGLEWNGIIFTTPFSPMLVCTPGLCLSTPPSLPGPSPWLSGPTFITTGYTPLPLMTPVLRRTKETSQYRRNTSNYGTCKEHLMCYMIIMHMSPYDTYGSM